jgi:hypothetical protein
MQINVYTIDFKLPRWLKRALIFAGIPGLVLGIGAVVWATVAVDTSAISASNVISATTIKSNFDNLKAAVDGLQTTVGQIPRMVIPFAGPTTSSTTTPIMIQSGYIVVTATSSGSGSGKITFPVIFPTATINVIATGASGNVSQADVSVSDGFISALGY